MTVKELKNKLSGMPDDAVILFLFDPDHGAAWEVARLDEGFYSREDEQEVSGTFYTEHQPDIEGLKHAVCLMDTMDAKVW